MAEVTGLRVAVAGPCVGPQASAWHMTCSNCRSPMSKILVVEDDSALLQLLEVGLSRRGHDVAIAENGEVALQVAESLQPDLVVTDLVMPVLDGYELLIQLRERADTCDIPVIVLSEVQGKESRLAAFRIGCGDFLPKPFELEELYLRIDNLLGLHGRGPGHLSSEPPGVTLHGCLEDIPLPSVLNLLAMDAKSGVLEIKEGDFCARLYLDSGRLVDAVDSADPERDPFEVVCRALRLRQGKFAAHDDFVSRPDRLHKSMTALLLDAFANIDENVQRAPGG